MLVLLGSDDAGTVHLHVVVQRHEPLSALVGITVKSTGSDNFLLRADTDLLGSGELSISTLSFIRAPDPNENVYRPKGPTGERLLESAEQLLLRITEKKRVVTMAVSSGLTFARLDHPFADGVPRVRLFVQTHTMGRADMNIDILECMQVD
jgi:hypothetical protein